MWWMMLGSCLLIPVVMLFAGKLFQKNVPKKVNRIVGYRTVMSMKNEDTWQFAHKTAGKIWWKWGWAALAIAVLPMLLVLGKGEDTVAAVGLAVMVVQMVPLLAAIPYTEKALRKTFDKDGNRK